MRVSHLRTFEQNRLHLLGRIRLPQMFVNDEKRKPPSSVKESASMTSKVLTPMDEGTKGEGHRLQRKAESLFLSNKNISMRLTYLPSHKEPVVRRRSLPTRNGTERMIATRRFGTRRERETRDETRTSMSRLQSSNLPQFPFNVISRSLAVSLIQSVARCVPRSVRQGTGGRW